MYPVYHSSYSTVLYRVFYSLGLYFGEASYYQERMKHKAVLVFLIIVTMTFSVQHTYASSAAVLDYDIMIEKADFIVVGNVTRIHNYTYTYVTIAIREFVTNPQNMSQITITIGGELQHAGELSRDSFEVGERVFVFVEKIGPYYRVLSGEAGKYRVWERSTIKYARHDIINGWAAVPGLGYRTVIYSNLTGADSSNGAPSSLAGTKPAVMAVPEPEPQMTWLIPVIMVALLMLMKWRKMIP